MIAVAWLDREDRSGFPLVVRLFADESDALTFRDEIAEFHDNQQGEPVEIRDEYLDGKEFDIVRQSDGHPVGLIVISEGP